ncbi:MAG: tRNA (adenosine(37)-N6)-dimethylallyltransferase MiaA [Bacteroidota bacterium]
MSSKYLITVTGPTAIGKTSWGIILAQHFNTEILSADSRQFFKEMSVGTAVPSQRELDQVPHHFVQHTSIFNTYSVGDYERDAMAVLTRLFRDTNVLVLVGGSGLYVDAVTKGLDRFPKIDPSVREALTRLLQSEGIESLQGLLAQKDPQYAERVDMKNPHRIIRALEVSIGAKKPYSTFLNQKKAKRPFSVLSLGLHADRNIIYKRIEDRVDHMMGNGLLEEARELYGHRNLNALQTVGYRELFRHFDGEWTLDFAISEIKKNTRRFAKRQHTWFTKNQDTVWFDYNSPKEEVLSILQKKLNQDQES